MDHRIKSIIVFMLVALAATALVSGCSDILFLNQLKEIAGLGSGVMEVTNQGIAISRNGVLSVNGFVVYASPPATFYIEIENRGVSELNNVIVDIGTGSSEFSVSSNPPPVITPGMKAQFSIFFDPSYAGFRSFPVTIKSSDPNGDYSFRIEGSLMGWAGLAGTGGSNGRDLLLYSQYLFAANNNGVTVFDTSDPVMLVYKNQVSSGGSINALGIVNNHLLTGGTGGIYFGVWDINEIISQPSPGPLGTVSPPFGITGIAVNPSTPEVYATSMSNEVFRINVGSPTFPFIDSTCFTTASTGTDIAFNEATQRAYSVMDSSGPYLKVIDTTYNPMTEINSLGLPSLAKRIQLISPQELIISTAGNCISANISDPDNPSFAFIAPAGSGFVVSYPYFIVGDISIPRGIRVIDMSQGNSEVIYMPPSPSDSTEIQAIAKNGPYLYAITVNGNVNVYVLPPGI
jgi:hypothetical protein